MDELDELDILLDLEDESEIYLELELDQGFEEDGNEFQENDSDVRDGLRDWLIEIGKYPLLSAKQEVDLAKKIEQGDQKAKDDLVLSNLRLAVSIAKRYTNNFLVLQDLIQEGNIGLIKAAEMFNWRKGFRFSTYATVWIRQKIRRAIFEKGKIIREPVYIHDLIQKISSLMSSFESVYGREPNLNELLELTKSDPKFEKLPVNCVEKVLRAKQLSCSESLEQNIQGNDLTIGDTVVDLEEDTPEVAVNKIAIIDCLKEILDNLTPREALVLRMRSGSYDGYPRTLEEVGREFGVTRERVRQIEIKAKTKIHTRGKFRKGREKLRQLTGYDQITAK